MGVMILLFCIFLVWMTYRRAARRRRARDAEDMALNREIAKYYREKRQGGTRGSPQTWGYETAKYFQSGAAMRDWMNSPRMSIWRTAS